LIEVAQPSLKPSGLEQLFVLFQRVVAGYCMLFGILYWVRLIGFYDDPLWRFDLMPLHWQVAAATLSVFFPFAAIGMWMLTSWGPVIWFICAAAEIAMYLGFPNLYGSRTPIVACHAFAALLFVAFRAVIHIRSRPPQQPKE
jgi:hypothetical protein